MSDGKNDGENIGKNHGESVVTQVRLDDGTVVWARVGEARELARGGGSYQDSGVGDRVADMAGGLADAVRGVVRSLRLGLSAAVPQQVTVEFGIELAAKSGQVIGLIADGGGKAAINVTLTWSERSEPVGVPPRPSSPPVPAAPPADGDDPTPTAP